MKDKKYLAVILGFSFYALFTLFIIFFFMILATLKVYKKMPLANKNLLHENNNSSEKNNETVAIAPGEMKKFASEKAFKEYLDKAGNDTIYYNMRRLASPEAFGNMAAMDEALDMRAPVAMKGESYASESDRVSETNVQVIGIDEPDILKTDGKEIFYSASPNCVYYEDAIPEKGMGIRMDMPACSKAETKLVKAFPPKELSLDGKIEENGNLLLYKNILMVSTYNKVLGYDVSNSASSTKKWDLQLEDEHQIVDERLHDGKLYLVTRKNINYSVPCPFHPFNINGKELNIVCEDIYYPTTPTETDVTYNLSVINPLDGNVEKTISFVGSASYSVIYMSPNAIYVTYHYTGDEASIIADFFSKECEDLLPGEILNKTQKLNGYDISQQSKMAELENILRKYYNSLSEDEQRRIQNEMTNRMSDYLKKRGRELDQTGIFKIDAKNLNILANGNIPGIILNQFSLDEYNGYLRVASTSGGRGNIFSGSGESFNDVYILDNQLKITGTVQDLGKGEKIYSVRFMADRGYVVTFRETDPFYILDLADVNNPQLKGELKIPGFSSYLHPIVKDRILGIGRENSQIKISLFDVSSAENPKEADKYILDEYWSEAINNHHAFLQDEKHGIFFMPGSNGGYIFSYLNDKLKLEKVLADTQVKRALYLDDYLYMAGESGITVLNETTWEKVNQLKF